VRAPPGGDGVITAGLLALVNRSLTRVPSSAPAVAAIIPSSR
jgi:hypothetical protein